MHLNIKRFASVGYVLFGISFLLALMYDSSRLTAVETVHAQTSPAISFQGVGATVNEADGSITVNVIISQAPTTTASISYRTFPGTATTGDFTSVQGTLEFDVGSTNPESITIQIINDTLPEPSEYFTVFLYDPVNARVVDPSLFTITIIDNDPTVTPTPTGGAPIFADTLEPNNSFNDASTIDAGATARCSLTFYPPGDEDYFRWWGQSGITYRVFTNNLQPGIDTHLRVYDTNQNQMGENDDQSPGSRNSSFEFTATVTGYYYARVVNTVPGDPIDKTYCFEVSRSVQPTLTPPPAAPPGADECEFNSTFEFACLLVVGETKSLSFVPTLGSDRDTDTFRLWIKPGIFYTCETNIPSGSAADTNIILYDHNTNPFNPWIGNDDKAPGDFGSKVQYLSTYTGWLYLQIGPVNVPPYEEAHLHTYTLSCSQEVSTPTPTATNTVAAPPAPPGGFSTATPQPTIEFPTPLPTPTPIDPSDFIPTAVPPPIIDVQPLPTATSAAGAGQAINIRVTVYYDSNNNYLPELTEGIINTAVSLFDNATGELLSYGHTNEAGVIHFENILATGTVRVVVPYLNYNQIVTQANDEILIRVAPGTLPIGIP